ncbi:MAG TPA: collagen-like protein [Candidatus Limosilactobacillus intestinavium]|nr:collagen-like protein [Candidatus Limosilactobacillus intestinavium]
MVDNDDPIMVRQIINAAGYDTETGIYGVGYSPDNGKTFYVQNTSAGRKFRQQDADGLWPFLIDKIKSIMSVDWDSIQNKPKFVTPDELETRLDKLSVPTVKWADIEDKPPIPSIDGLVKETELADYAKKSDLPTMPDLSGYATVSSLIDYAKKSDLPDFSKYALKNELPITMAWQNITGKPGLATQDDLKKIELMPGPKGNPGADGKDGVTPHIDSTTGDWFIGNQDTGTQAQGPAGENGRDGVDGQPGKDGQNGITPHIDTATGNWFIGSTNTGIKAQGPQGVPGEPGKDAPLPDMSQYALVSSLDKLKATLNSNIDASKVAYEQIYPTLINGTTGSVNAFLITLSEKVKMLSFWAHVTLPTIPSWSQVDIMSFPQMYEQNHITLNQSVIPDNGHSLWADFSSTSFSLRNQTGATVSNYNFSFFSSGIFLY